MDPECDRIELLSGAVRSGAPDQMHPEIQDEASHEHREASSQKGGQPLHEPTDARGGLATTRGHRRIPRWTLPDELAIPMPTPSLTRRSG
jgi:hypothetical protein